MTLALWIIAICEIIRCVQNSRQLDMMKHSREGYETACSEFVKSLNKTDTELVEQVLKDIELHKVNLTTSAAGGDWDCTMTTEGHDDDDE